MKRRVSPQSILPGLVRLLRAFWPEIRCQRRLLLRPWKPFGSAVVHYPAPGRTPIVQTLLPAAWEKAQL